MYHCATSFNFHNLHHQKIHACHPLKTCLLVFWSLLDQAWPICKLIVDLVLKRYKLHKVQSRWCVTHAEFHTTASAADPSCLNVVIPSHAVAEKRRNKCMLRQVDAFLLLDVSRSFRQKSCSDSMVAWWLWGNEGYSQSTSSQLYFFRLPWEQWGVIIILWVELKVTCIPYVFHPPLERPEVRSALIEMPGGQWVNK